MTELRERTRTAHGDAWQLEGRLRAGRGGGWAELPGARLMASGLGHPQWNSGDVDDVSQLDLDRVRSWYSALGVPFGLRVPAEMPLGAGRVLFAKQLLALAPGRLVAPDPVAGLTIRAARASELDVVARIDAEAFGETLTDTARWIEPRLTSAAHHVALAELGGERVGVATVCVADGRAGRTAHISGVCVLERARGRGVGAALSAWAAERGLERGATLVHLHPSGETSARLYGRLGFVDAGALDVYVDV